MGGEFEEGVVLVRCGDGDADPVLAVRPDQQAVVGRAVDEVRPCARQAAARRSWPVTAARVKPASRSADVTRARSATTTSVRASSSSEASSEAMAAACETLVAVNGT